MTDLTKETRRQGNQFYFDELVINSTEKGIPKGDENDWYIGLEHLDSGSLVVTRWGAHSAISGQKLKMHKGDILFAKRNAYLKRVALAPHDGFFSAHGLVLRPRENSHVLPEFIPYLMQSEVFWETAIKISVGSLSPTINWSELRKQEFMLPPLQEQARIVEAANAIRSLKQKLVEAKEKAEAVWLSSITAFEISDLTKVMTLDSLLVGIDSGVSLAGTNIPPNLDERGVIKVSAIDPRGFNPRESKTLIEQNEFKSDVSVCRGDLIITRANTAKLVGECCLLQEDHPNLMLSDKTLRLRVKEHVNKNLLWHMLQSRIVRSQIMQLATGTGANMKNLSQASIRSLKISYPLDINQVATMNRKISQVFQTIHQLDERLDDLNSINKNFMHVFNSV